MKIAILGTGAIGGVLAGCLSDTSADLVCVSRGRTARELLEGLTLFTPEGSVEMIPGERFEIVDSDKGPLDERVCGTCDVAIVSGKSGSTPQLASMAEDLVKQEACVISIQNGLGNSGIIASRVGWERVLGGTTTHSAWRDGDGAVHWTGRGSISLGSINSSEPNSIATEFISYLDEGGLAPNWSFDIEREIWRKLTINVAINPICAIAGIRNGALAEVPELWQQAIEAMREAEAVARASGVNLGDSDSESYLRKVVESTAENRVSMLQDLMAGRKTEIDVLCGAVISKGEEFGVPTPRNEVLMALVRGIEMSQQLD